MATISLCMIVKDEESVIGRCLDSIKSVVDEIIIVDTGSSDNTKEIISKYTDKIFDFKWIDDFSAARNYSFSKATMDYIMWLDADDIVKENDRINLTKFKEALDSSIDVVMMLYNVSFDEDDNPNLYYYRERILKNNKNFTWVGPIHEVILPMGNIIYSDIAISHKKIYRNDPKRNLRIFRKLISEGEVLDPRQKFYYARELYYNKEYYEAIKEFTEFIESGNGWIENVISGCKDLAECYFQIGDNEKGIEYLFKSFQFDEPRAEILCDIGGYFIKIEKYKNAIFWYDLAVKLSSNTKSGGFKLYDCYGYIPYLQMCVCYDKLGDIAMASYYNEKAGEIKPNDKSVKYNREYFSNMKGM